MDQLRDQNKTSEKQIYELSNKEFKITTTKSLNELKKRTKVDN